MGAMMAEPWNDPERASSSSSRPGWARPGCPERCSRTSAGCRCSSGCSGAAGPRRWSTRWSSRPPRTAATTSSSRRRAASGWRWCAAARTTCSSRFLLALDEHPADAVVRVTADCPFVDPDLVDAVVGAWRAVEGLDYVSTVLVRTLPHGLDVELVTAEALRRVGDVASGPPPGARDLRRLHRARRLLRHGAVLRARRERPAGHPRHPGRPADAARRRRRARAPRCRPVPSSSPCCGRGPTSRRSTPRCGRRPWPRADADPAAL